MRVSLMFCKRLLWVCAGLLVTVALVIALGVVQPVKAYVTPDVSPERAVPAFWINVGLNLLAAVILASMAIWSKGKSRLSTSVLVVLGLVVLFLAFALTDAASAYRAEGSALRTVTVLLVLCAAASGLAGVLVIATAFLRPKKP